MNPDKRNSSVNYQTFHPTPSNAYPNLSNQPPTNTHLYPQISPPTPTYQDQVQLETNYYPEGGYVYVPTYPKYHPQFYIHYAKKSKRNCCCVISCCCCCLFFLIGIIIGGIFGVIAIECANLSHIQTKNYTIPNAASNLIQLNVNNINGKITFVNGFNTTDLLIAIDEYGPDGSDVNTFTTTFINNNGEATIAQKINPTGNKLRDVFHMCRTTDITVTLPSSWGTNGVTIVAKTTNGEIDWEADVNATFKSVSLHTTNGHVEVNGKLSSSIISLESTNGHIESNSAITLSDAYYVPSLTTATTNGHIEMSSIISATNANISLRTTNGHVETTFSQFVGTFSLKTTNGKIQANGSNVHLDTDDSHSKIGYVTHRTGGNINVSSTNGHVYSTWQ